MLIGVSDDGHIAGLNSADVSRLNQLLSNASSQSVRPPINPSTMNVHTRNGIVIAVDVAEGLNKPYVDTLGRIWVKNGADKRHVTAREEMQRLFQSSGLVYADEVPVRPATIKDLDLDTFGQYFERRYKKSVEATGLSLSQLLNNLNLAQENFLSLAGLLLFGKAPHVYKPSFIVKAVAFPGTVLHDKRYLDSEDIDGNLLEQYRRAMAFLRRNLRHVQGDQGFNSPGLLEIPEDVFEELLVNALIHRDYFLSASIRLLIFSDRVEIISPGHLPDHLDTEKIRYGISNLRNPALASHAFSILPYRGLGSGIPRALATWPDLELIDDRPGNQFKAVAHRPVDGDVQPESQPESLEDPIMRILTDKPASKVDISRKLGQKQISGQLNKVVRKLLEAGMIEYTIPEKPKSRLQKYKIRSD